MEGKLPLKLDIDETNDSDPPKDQISKIKYQQRPDDVTVSRTTWGESLRRLGLITPPSHPTTTQDNGGIELGGIGESEGDGIKGMA